DRPLAQADRFHGRDARAGEGADGHVQELLPREPAGGRAAGAGAARRGARRRLQHARRPGALPRMARPRPRGGRAGRARALRPRVLRRARGGAGGGGGPGRGAAGGAGGQGLRRGRSAARRDRGARLGGSRRSGRLRARTPVTREQVYGRRPVREALRGRREVLELWATDRALKVEAWLREVERPRVQTKLERELSEAAGTRDHQGVVAWCEPYRYADGWELAAAGRPLLACLDQVTDPRNLGAVIRTADGVGATGVVVPAP